MQQIDLQHLISRVASWNNARYDRVYNSELLCKLLLEELNETLSAASEGDTVEMLDGLCDVSFVALGGIWKAGLDGQDLGFAYNKAIEFCRTLQDGVQVIGPSATITACINQLQDKESDMYDVTTLCFCIMLMSFMQAAQWWGMDLDVYTRAMHVVCDSNDSKSVKKVAADVKANSNDKGNNFVPPTAGLTELLINCGAIKH